MSDLSIQEELRTLGDRIASLSEQMGHMVRHVAEVRSSNVRLESELKDMRADLAVVKDDVAVLKADVAVLKADVAVLKADVATLKEQMAEQNRKTDYLSGKIDHFVKFSDRETSEVRLRIENEKYDREAGQRNINARFEMVEARLDRIEAVIPDLARE